jgi:hypothetical protein
MNIAIRLTVGIVFIVLAIAFIGLSAVMVHEFRDTDWFAIAAFDSQLFLFFPLFGVMTLIAFYRPACVLLDIYWYQVGGGRWIISVALLVLTGLAPLVATSLASKAKALWDLQPRVLRDDRGQPAGCYDSDRRQAGELPTPDKSGGCERLPFNAALENLRTVSRSRFGMSAFIRNCRPDPLLAIPPRQLETRYCFANNKMQTAAQCCTAQKLFINAIEAHTRSQAVSSMTRKWYYRLLPFHVFFLLLIFGIGISLVLRGKLLDLEKYDSVRGGVESRILAGAVLMLFWPLLNHMFLQSADVLYGNETKSTFRIIAPVFTAIFCLWALMLLFFFFRAFPETIKKVGQMAGIIGSAVAFIKFDEIVGALSRLVGSGSDQTSIAIVVLVVGGIILLAATNRNLLTPGDKDRDDKAT